MLNRMLERTTDNNGTGTSAFTDIAGHWAEEEIIAATQKR